jgi:nuclear receptor interaction protein
MSFRVRYGNGESEDIPIPSLSNSLADAPEEVIERARSSVLSEAQKLSLQIAKGLVKLRRALFSLEASVREATQSQRHYDVAPYAASFTSTLGYSATYLPQMDEISRSWRYPMDPTPDDVIFQQTLRRNREAARRFVQASGVLARFLGGRIQNLSRADSPQLELFQVIVPAPTEDGVIDPESQFGYDFLKAIILWIEGGRPALVEGFKLNQQSPRNIGRYPIAAHGDDKAIEEVLIPYLRNLAGSAPIVDVDTSRFEHDASRIIFESQQAAVTAFSNAVKLTLIHDMENTASRAEETGSSEHIVRALNWRAARKFWGFRVGRGLLMQVGEGINFELVNRAFGGLRTFVDEDDGDDDGRERLQEDIDPDEDEEQVEEIRLVSGRRRVRATGDDDSAHSALPGGDDAEEMNDLEDADEDDEDNDSFAVFDESDDEDADEDEEDIGGFFMGGNFRNGRPREDVEIDVPCSSHHNTYRGHCNIKTVKDVNYFGMDDEYVVSGSDSGHVFIWERKTAKLVNILEGDGEVVNVAQGTFS